jgi:hypothetical protein
VIQILKKKTFFILAFIIVIVVSTILIYENVNKQKKFNNEFGISNGNILADGRFAEDSGYVYYSSGGLWRSKFDATDKKQLFSQDAHYINIVGDTLYFRSGNRIIKMKKDGGEQKVIVKGNVFIGPIIYNNDLFYIKNDDKGFKTSIVRATIDGRIIRTYYEAADKLNIYNNTLYFCKNDGDLYNLYSINIDGKDKKKILTLNFYERYIVDDGWIYYTDDQFNLYRVDINGKNKTLLNEGVPLNFNINNDFIFFTPSIKNPKDKVTFYKMKKDGS